MTEQSRAGSEEERAPEFHRLFRERRESAVDKEAWHLSKSVPLAFVIALMVQTAALVSWAVTFRAEFVSFRAETDRRFDQERRLVEQKTQDRITNARVIAELKIRDERLRAVEKMDDQTQQTVLRLQSNIENKLQRIEAKMDDHAASSSPHMSFFSSGVGTLFPSDSSRRYQTGGMNGMGTNGNGKDRRWVNPSEEN